MTKSSALETGPMDARIQELVTFARDRDGEDRTVLFRNLIDLFLTGKAPKKEPTRSQILDVVEAMIPHVEPESRRTVADLVSQMSDPPLDLIRRLVKDLPHLVGDLLLSPTLTEDDIVDLIATTGREHHHIIASRTDLSANIWIALARAAPTAKKAQAPSSLALWSTALGGSGSETSNNLVAMHQPTPDVNSERPQSSAATAITDVFRDDARDTTSPETSTSDGRTAPTDLHEGTSSDQEARKAASLRILRTDRDLISDRLADSNSGQANRPHPDMQSLSQPDKQDSVRTSHDRVTRADHNTAQHPSVSLPAEPENGGWCWRSDRDGLIIAVSNAGQRLFARASWQSQAPNNLQGASIIGMGMLDLLSLNEKMGHPLARAFQRRSAVHDVPLTLEALEDDAKNWLIEAIPLFNSASGAFEGYEGIMAPFAHSADDPDVFLDTPVAPSSIRPQSALKSGDTLLDESIDRTTTPPPASRTTSPQHDEKPSTSPTPTPEGGDIHDMTTQAVMQAIADALGSAANPTGNDTPQNSATTKANTKQTGDELNATLDLLEESLSTLLESSKTSGGSRLQAEIASACLRALRDQLKP